MKDHVYIVGAGAIGKSLAVFLSQAGRTVTLVRASHDNGLEERMTVNIVLNDGSNVQSKIRVTTFSREKAFDGVVVLTNKAFANKQIANLLLNKTASSPVVVMQNGLDVERPFLTVDFDNIYRCVLFATSQTIDDHTVRYKPVATSLIGKIKGDARQLNAIAALLDTPLFRFSGVADIQPLIWKKVIANCVFNSICPLLDVDNGIFHRDENARRLAVEVIAECVVVAGYENVHLDPEEILQTVLHISVSADGQDISTLQDIKNKRPTEIDSLNLAITAIAEKMNKPMTVAKTRLLGELTKLKSQVSLVG